MAAPVKNFSIFIEINMNGMSPNERRISLLVLCQALLSWIAAYLISKISLIGRIGIATVHREYRVLRSAWETFLLLLGVQVAIIVILRIIQIKYSRKVTIIATSLLMLIAVLGLLVTLWDFLNTYTHRLLKERFHLGFYFFWLGWIGTCLFFLTIKEVKKGYGADPFPPDPDAPSRVPSGAPSNVPSDGFADTPSGAPSNMTSNEI
jgi:hypothetical protein